MLKGVVGKGGYTIACICASLILVASGYAYYVKAQVGGIGGSDVAAGGPSTGAMNILLMGLESRTRFDGTPLPRSLLDAMHAGSIGGEATNTLILIHIFAGGRKAVGFSIPRDDYVKLYGTMGYDGITEDKIDSAYAYAMSAREDQLIQQDPGMSSITRTLKGNEAGQQAEVDTVEALTGVHIDHFAELNLFGFYELAQVFGGIEVCLNHATSDPDYSGANFKAGYQFLDAAQALAFVRQRHNLPNGDLDRTHRQQAVLDYVLWKLKHEGLLSDLSQLSSLMGIARDYMITSGGWNLLQFAGEMQGLAGDNMTFQTLPITGEENLPGSGDVNTVDPAALKKIVQDTFYPPATVPAPATKTSAPVSLSPAQTTVDVYNGGDTSGLAASLSQALTRAGFKAGKVGDIAVQSSTRVLYGTGAAASAAKIAGYFTGITAAASSSVAPGHVEILLGTDATSVPAGIGSSGASASPSAPASSSPSTAGIPAAELQGNGQAGGVVSVKANSPYGIPCVN